MKKAISKGTYLPFFEIVLGSTQKFLVEIKCTAFETFANSVDISVPE